MTKLRLALAWVLLVGALIGWPLSAMTVAKKEPQFILGLSWVAILLEGFNGVQIAADREDDEEDGG